MVTSAQITVGNTAVSLIAASGRTRVLIVTNGGAGFIGPSGVTISTGFPVFASTAVALDLGHGDELFGICDNNTLKFSVIATS